MKLKIFKVLHFYWKWGLRYTPLVGMKQAPIIGPIPACTINRDSRSDFCDRDSRSDFGVVVERANHNFLEGVPSLYL